MSILFASSYNQYAIRLKQYAQIDEMQIRILFSVPAE